MAQRWALALVGLLYMPLFHAAQASRDSDLASSGSFLLTSSPDSVSSVWNGVPTIGGAAGGTANLRSVISNTVADSIVNGKHWNAANYNGVHINVWNPNDDPYRNPYGYDGNSYSAVFGTLGNIITNYGFYCGHLKVSQNGGWTGDLLIAVWATYGPLRGNGCDGNWQF